MSDLFAAPGYGLAFALVPLLWWVLASGERRRSRRLAAVVGPRVGVLAGERSPRRVRTGTLLGTGGLALCVLACMQPLLGTAESAALQPGTDLCVCLDVSRSMLARDVQPSRLVEAQEAIAALGRRTRGDRLALVVFAGAARLRVPLTRDVASLAEIARTTDPVDVPLGGTRLDAAIDAAVAALAAGQAGNATAGAALDGAVLLITDGEDRSGNGRAAAARARARGVRVHCAGIGSALGSKITVRDTEGRESFLRDKEGREVVSKMDAASLRGLAQAGGGVFVDAGSEAAPLVQLYERGVLPHLDPARGAAARAAVLRANRYQVPLALGIVLLLAELLLPRRRRRRGGAA